MSPINKLLGDRIQVEPIIETMARGFHLPLTATDYYNTGGPKVFRVIRVGTGRVTKRGVTVPIECEPGDKVICYSYNAAPEKFDDKTFIVTTEQILAIIPKQPCAPTNT
jgi:co-chaperonin GroES (HSP10)